MTGYVIRRAVVGDAAIVAHHRVAMFRDMGQVPTGTLASALLEASTAALIDILSDGSYVGWLAINGNSQVIAGAGAHIKPQLPRISLDGTRLVTAPVPLIVNVYTEPGWREKGVARTLMKAAMEWATAQGSDQLLLHASDAARPLYLSFGFTVTNEMRWASDDGCESASATE